jgi:glucose dehydrogenase
VEKIRARGAFVGLIGLAILGIGAVVGGCNVRERTDSGFGPSDAALRDADANRAEWLSYGRTYGEQRYSPLDQIDESNVGELGLAWSYDLASDHGVEATPIVADGVMYVSAPWSIVLALDAATGERLWPSIPRCRVRTRASLLRRRQSRRRPLGRVASSSAPSTAA